MTTRALLVVGAAALLVLLASCGGTGQAGGSSVGLAAPGTSVALIPPDQRQPVPATAGTTLEDGRALSVNDYPGQVVMVNFWASWCGPCRAETPALQRLQEQLGPRGLQLLGVNFRDQRSAALAFVDRYGTTWPSIVDQGGSVSSRYVGLFIAPPTTLVLDRNHRVAARIQGEVVAEQTSPVVERLLSEPR